MEQPPLSEQTSIAKPLLSPESKEKTAVPNQPADQLDQIRDPFESNLPTAPIPVEVKSEKRVKSASSAVLEGVSMSNKGAKAIINGEIYSKNEEKNGIIVTQIRKNEVDIIINGVSETLRLFELDAATAKVTK